MAKYKIYRPNLPISVIEADFISGPDLADMLGGYYSNVTHIERFRKMVPPCTQILVQECRPDEEIPMNDIFDDVQGTVILIEGMCSVN